MRVALLFPGQGEQHPGILHDLPAGSDDLLDAAADTLGEDATLLDSAEALRGTRATQLALLVSGVAWARAAISAGLEPDYLAGHSLGLWTAAVVADAVDFTDAVRLVDVRARAMHRCAPPGSGMIAIDGVSPDVVDATAMQLRRDGRHVWATNVNSRSQCSASGTREDLQELTEILREARARRVTTLAVSVPAHTPLMRDAEDDVRRELEAVDIRRPRIPVASNVTGQTLFTADRLREDLSASITHGVRWDRATAILSERGVGVWIQLPPGRSLLRLVPDGTTLAMEDLGVAEVVRVTRRRSAPV